MTNTNLLNLHIPEDISLDQFLTEGALLQTSKDHFKLFIGPFEGSSSMAGTDGPVIYSPEFWSFLQSDQQEHIYFKPRRFFEGSRQLVKAFMEKAAANKSTQIVWKKPEFSDFRKQYDWIQKQISAGHFSKAVPIAIQRGDGDIRCRLADLIHRITNQETNNFAYGIWSGQRGMIGTTPEVLCGWDENQSTLQTMALAGTWNKQKHAEINFLDPKIQHEHNLVVQDIQAQLVHLDQLEKSNTEAIELPHLFHLKTRLIYRCNTLKEYIQSVDRLHPTAALGVYPRSLGYMKTFSEFDLQKKRGRFGAPFGYISLQSGFMLVGIRNIMWAENQVELFAGCGVTAESQFEAEWNEIIDKQESVKKMLGIEF